ncbi:substrate-binding periplasmic protein [Humidesulfovibrio idahonensis]
MALQAGKVDAVLSPRFGVDYFVKRNAAFKVVASEPLKAQVVMALRSEDTQLKDDLDKAISTLQENGKLKQLEDEWVTNLPAANEPANKAADPIPGAKTVYVGICGDYVPLDYIAANGRPAGFNVALLNEISHMLNVNFEFVSLESQARFAALSAKKIDLIFCNLTASTPSLMGMQNKSWVATKPYFTSEVGCLLVRK